VRQKAARHLAQIAREFHARGWMWGTSGNLSIRLSQSPLAFLVTAGGLGKDRLTERDVLLVGAGCEPLEHWEGRPSAETPVHERMYRVLDAGAVFHIHSVMAGVVSDYFWPRRKVVLRELEMLKGLGHAHPQVQVAIPIAENHEDSNVIADRVVGAAVPGVPGVLVRNHGLYAWGRDAAEARSRVEIFEYLMAYAYHRALLRPRR